ncbi:expressed unknown protein [Seminavis robusta]|uniref:Uncharacterized protein n=1 Tax=Seminavis robusta TaxID=568900 RepID=A0A9N8HAE5_9STRA|nr:expressed unknown protein [Seminavis robusta]|eukprot:Sro317_g115690.1 n/a (569) ;mRNA; f:9710-11416
MFLSSTSRAANKQISSLSSTRRNNNNVEDKMRQPVSPSEGGPVIKFMDDHHHDEEKKEDETDAFLPKKKQSSALTDKTNDINNDQSYSSKDKQPKPTTNFLTFCQNKIVKQTLTIMASLMAVLFLLKTISPSTSTFQNSNDTTKSYAYYTHPNSRINNRHKSSNKQPFISWEMQAHIPYKPTYQETFNQAYRCNPGGYMDRVPLRPELEPKLWFQTKLQTSLHILVMGDSVAMQLGELLQEAMGVQVENRVLLRQLDGEDETHESLFWGTTNQGGGGSGGFRILHWWLRRNQGKPLPETSGGGWRMADVDKLLQNMKTMKQHQVAMTSGKGIDVPDQAMDVLVFRVSQPWMGWETIDAGGMQKTIEVAHEQLKVKVVVFLTIPFSNNIVDKTDILTMQKKNAMMKQFAADYAKNPFKGVTVMVLDLGQLHDSVMKVHAKGLGYKFKSSNDYDFGLDILKPRADYYSHSIGHVCGERAPTKAQGCKHYNMITFDGQHLCMKTFGGRLFAGLACVTRCAYAYGDDESATDDLRECEHACNDQYMSLEEIDESMFVAPPPEDKDERQRRHE